MSAPAWSPVDDDTASLLDLIASDEMTPRPQEEWAEFVDALSIASGDSGHVDPNQFRELIRGHIAPRRIGAFTNRAKSEGLIVDTGEWVISDDHEGRNAGRPCRVYRLVT